MDYQIVDLLSDPQKHNSEEYIYLVHSIQGYKGKYLEITELEKIIKHLTSKSTLYSASLIGRSKGDIVKKYDLNFKPGFDQTATHTFVGFIIKPEDVFSPEEKIPIAWNCDLLSPTSQEELRRFVDNYSGKKRPLNELLNNSLGMKWILPRNELIVEGSQNSIKGVFYVNLKGVWNFQDEGEEIQKLATKVLGYDLPLVEVIYQPPDTSSEGEKMIKDLHHRYHLEQSFKDFRKDVAYSWYEDLSNLQNIEEIAEKIIERYKAREKEDG